MQVKKFLCTMALSCGLVALPALAQSSSQSTSPSDQTTPAAPSASQNSSSTSSGAYGQQSSGTSASDSSSIQSNVQSALQKDDQLAGQNVNAEVGDNNKLTLSGTVSSQAQKDHAEQVATQAAPGYTVKNKIKVSGSSSSPMSEQQPKQ